MTALSVNQTCNVRDTLLTSYSWTKLIQVKPMDEELVLRSGFKSRLSMRQRHIHHRQSLMKELGAMRGAIVDFVSTCRQVLSALTWHQFNAHFTIEMLKVFRILLQMQLRSSGRWDMFEGRWHSRQTLPPYWRQTTPGKVVIICVVV